VAFRSSKRVDKGGHLLPSVQKRIKYFLEHWDIAARDPERLPESDEDRQNSDTDLGITHSHIKIVDQ
jgi:hypothetical protein